MARPITIALTGGIGSGKTTIANLFKRLGIPIIDTDLIAREIVEPGQPAYSEIIQQFGNAIVAEDGKLDRKKLSEIIFKNSTQKKTLESLLHPLIFREIDRIVQTLDCLYCIVVIPLLVETGKADEFDRVLVVDVTPETQLARTTSRDNISVEKAKAIMSNQISREQRLQIADDVIDNDNVDQTELSGQVSDLHESYILLNNKKQ